MDLTWCFHISQQLTQISFLKWLSHISHGCNNFYSIAPLYRTSIPSLHSMSLSTLGSQYILTRKTDWLKLHFSTFMMNPFLMNYRSKLFFLKCGIIFLGTWGYCCHLHSSVVLFPCTNALAFQLMLQSVSSIDTHFDTLVLASYNELGFALDFFGGAGGNSLLLMLFNA